MVQDIIVSARITLDLVRNTTEFRSDSYRRVRGIDDIKVVAKVDTKHSWMKRKDYALTEEFTSMEELIRLARSDVKKPFATPKPTEIIEFVIEPVEREWKPQWQAQLQQL